MAANFQHPNKGGSSAPLDNTTTATTPAGASQAVLYKTRPCEKFMSSGSCPYATHCVFAHGTAELRTVAQNIEDGVTDRAGISRLRQRAAQRRKRVSRAIRRAQDRQCDEGSDDDDGSETGAGNDVAKQILPVAAAAQPVAPAGPQQRIDHIVLSSYGGGGGGSSYPALQGAPQNATAVLPVPNGAAPIAGLRTGLTEAVAPRQYQQPQQPFVPIQQHQVQLMFQPSSAPTAQSHFALPPGHQYVVVNAIPFLPAAQMPQQHQMGHWASVPANSTQPTQPPSAPMSPESSTPSPTAAGRVAAPRAATVANGAAGAAAANALSSSTRSSIGSPSDDMLITPPVGGMTGADLGAFGAAVGRSSETTKLTSSSVDSGNAAPADPWQTSGLHYEATAPSGAKIAPGAFW